jgi:hypothetical protein
MTLRIQRVHDLVGVGALQLRIDVAARECRRAFGEIEEQRREVLEADAQRAENGMRVLARAAVFGSDGYTLAAQVAHGLDAGIGAGDEIHRAGIHGRDHAQVEWLRKRRRAAQRPPDPVRRHEAEVDRALFELARVFRAGEARLDDVDGSGDACLHEHLPKCHALRRECAVPFRRAYAHGRSPVLRVRAVTVLTPP